MNAEGSTYNTEACINLLRVILNGGRHNMREMSDWEKINWLRHNLPRTYALLAANRNWDLMTTEVGES